MSDYTKLSVPGPTATELSAPFWEAANEGKLTLQVCDTCETYVFYPRPICPHCWRGKLHWREASGQGNIKSFSQIWKPGHPGWLPVAPYYVGLVQLKEGPTMLSHILANGHNPKIGEVVTLAPTKIAGRVLPFFKITQK